MQRQQQQQQQLNLRQRRGQPRPPWPWPGPVLLLASLLVVVVVGAAAVAGAAGAAAAGPASEASAAALASSLAAAAGAQPLPPPLDPGRLAFAASSKSSSSSSSASTRRRPWVNRPSSRSGRATSPAAGTSSSPAWARGGGRVLNNVGGGLLIPLFLFLKEAKASPFDPHPLPLLLGLCFFNGWYVRVTDHERQLAFALIVGSFKHPGANTYTEHYVALVYADRQGNLLTAHAFPDPDSVTIDMDSEGYAGVPSNFTWRSQEIGELHIDHNTGHFDFALPGFAAEATFHDRVPWNRAKPDVDGPEGWLGHTPLLPCRYFVYSLASRTSYRLRIRNNNNRGGGASGATSAGGVGSSASPVVSSAGPAATSPPSNAPPELLKPAMAGAGGSGGGGGGGGGGMGVFGVGGGRTEVISGRGFAHLESNYGNHFPRGWIWVNCIAPHREVKLVMVGGKFEIGPAAPTTWVIGYRSPRFHWNMRTTDLDVVQADVDYSARSLRLVARSRCGKHRLEVNVTAPESSFGSPIYVPTPTGFSCLPGCRESFTARARIKAVDASTAPEIALTEEHDVELAALEFGGDLQRL